MIFTFSSLKTTVGCFPLTPLLNFTWVIDLQSQFSVVSGYKLPNCLIQDEKAKQDQHTVENRFTFQVTCVGLFTICPPSQAEQAQPKFGSEPVETVSNHVHVLH